MLSYRVYKRKIVMFKLTPVTSKIGQGHPSSNLTKTLLRYIHGISFGSMRLIFVELSCLQAKCWRTDGRTDRRTDGQTDRRTDQSNSRVGYTQPAQKVIGQILRKLTCKQNLTKILIFEKTSGDAHPRELQVLTRHSNRSSGHTKLSGRFFMKSQHIKWKVDVKCRRTRHQKRLAEL